MWRKKVFLHYFSIYRELFGIFLIHTLFPTMLHINVFDYWRSNQKWSFDQDHDLIEIWSPIKFSSIFPTMHHINVLDYWQARVPTPLWLFGKFSSNFWHLEQNLLLDWHHCQYLEFQWSLHSSLEFHTFWKNHIDDLFLWKPFTAGQKI